MSSDNQTPDYSAERTMAANQGAYNAAVAALPSIGDTQSTEKNLYKGYSIPGFNIDNPNPDYQLAIQRQSGQLQVQFDNLAKVYQSRAQEIRQRMLYTGRDATVVAGDMDKQAAGAPLVPPPSLLGGVTKNG